MAGDARCNETCGRVLRGERVEKKKVWLAQGITQGQSLGQPGRAESPAVTSVSPFSGGNCQSAASHIALSLKLIAIVTPRDPEDANASAIALLVWRIRLLNRR